MDFFGAQCAIDAKMELSHVPLKKVKCDLQSFYENFDPDNNEDCMFDAQCRQVYEKNNCSQSFITEKTQKHEGHQGYIQITPELEKRDNWSAFFHWQQKAHEPLTKKASKWLGGKYSGCQLVKRSISKKKRTRTMFTTEQIISMEHIFKTRPYICQDERQELSQRLRVSERAIKVWFQNRRRMSEKSEKIELPDSPISVSTDIGEYSFEFESFADDCDSNSDRLAYIEHLIQERTDEFGNVVLDDTIMTELVSVIDERLSYDNATLLQILRSNNQDILTNSLVPEIFCEDNLIMYEPISPSSIDEFFQ